MALKNDLMEKRTDFSVKPVTNADYIIRQEETESNARSYPRKFPFSIARAKGSWVEDVEGNRYLDFLCGAGTLALGHNDPEVNQAMIEMISNDAPLHTLDLTTPVKDKFVHTLIALLPEELQTTVLPIEKNSSMTRRCSAVMTGSRVLSDSRGRFCVRGAWRTLRRTM